MRLLSVRNCALDADMSHIAHIIERFGGVRPMAAALGKPKSTVHSWLVRGSVPDRAKSEIVAKSAELGLGVQLTDFYPRSAS